MSLGAVGQGTDIDYVEIMNNVDDGIEIWGGKVHLKHVSIWNIGDDSFDIDEGWRGKAQYGLIVQGYSIDADQGSGLGDNMFEHDGAEDSDAQPVTTAVIANFTAIGAGNEQSADGDGATAWRDGCRMQYRNCIFMDCSEKVVRPDNVDGDGAQGYGYNGTLSMFDVFNTPYTTLPTNTIGVAPQSLYTAQVEGTLAGFKNCVFYNNKDYTEFNAFGQTNAALNNIILTTNDAPVIAGITRGPAFTSTQGKTVLPVISLDPCAAGAAVNVGGSVTADGFFDSVEYAGGFSANNNWLLGWTAADQFGMIDGSSHIAPASTITMGGVSVTFQSQPGVEYEILSSPDMAFTNTTVVATLVGDGSEMGYVDPALDTAKFYKAVYR